MAKRKAGRAPRAGESVPIAAGQAAQAYVARRGGFRPATTLDGVLANMAAHGMALQSAADRAGAAIAAELQQYAQTHHPWTVDTGLTNATTRGTSERVSDTQVVIVLSAGMHYDVYLELAHDGQWAWLHSAIEACAPKIEQILRREFGG